MCVFLRKLSDLLKIELLQKPNLGDALEQFGFLRFNFTPGDVYRRRIDWTSELYDEITLDMYHLIKG